MTKGSVFVGRREQKHVVINTLIACQEFAASNVQMRKPIQLSMLLTVEQLGTIVKNYFTLKILSLNRQWPANLYLWI